MKEVLFLLRKLETAKQIIFIITRNQFDFRI